MSKKRLQELYAIKDRINHADRLSSEDRERISEIEREIRRLQPKEKIDHVVDDWQGPTLEDNLKLIKETFGREPVEQDKAIEGLKKLREPFKKNQISLLPKPTRKENQKGMCKECGGYHGLPAVHIRYVGHAALTDRLLDADPFWNWEPVKTDENGFPVRDTHGGMWIKLTVCGVTRLGYGDADGKRDSPTAIKEIIGDALRNAAMRFGAALDLWHKGDLHLPTATQEDVPDDDKLSAAIDWINSFIPRNLPLETFEKEMKLKEANFSKFRKADQKEINQEIEQVRKYLKEQESEQEETEKPEVDQEI